MQGTLYVVATPIGNLGDFSNRARELLASADLVAAEDTRHSRKLLSHYSISTPMVSLHAHNEAARTPELLERLAAGDSIALISDAGTPLISDPGGRLVAAAAGRDVRVVPVPGACALVAALSASGLNADNIYFQGFLPAREAARHGRLQALAAIPATLVFYVAPHRLARELEAVSAVLGAERRAVIARELTKIHETFYRDTLGRLLERVADDPDMSKGELVLLIEGAESEVAAPAELERMADILVEYLSTRDAARALARLGPCARNTAYRLASEAAERQG